MQTDTAFNKKLEKILTEINKPSRYIGNELGSANKDWEKTDLKFAFAFPDLYEVGISNLGFRILYHVINDTSEGRNYLGDRVYAPEKDFRDKLKENNFPLFGVETHRPLNEFDVIGFTLQYELSYPTVLEMLNLSGIPIKSADRTEQHPLIIAGGPCAYNPEPMSAFIDLFLVGDGEDVIIEFMDKLKTLKEQGKSRIEILQELTSIEGIYVPALYKAEGEFDKPTPINPQIPSIINKRIFNFDDKKFPLDFPVPFSPSVHDRAVVEIRRGCGRMCRFCQACFTNFPVRERHPMSVENLVSQVLKNTGYEEYSLLSLSSNDYKNIEPLVALLNSEHGPNGASVSLPSQRADSFSLTLAELVQSIRKSTLTFAPEAGSQRLRDVINKNLNEQQIIDAIMACYKSGWNKVKLYFMFGLPTETFEDLQAIIDLIRKIKEEGKKLKFQENINKHLDITCTMSIFVPKPFTPFQWFGQDSVELIYEKRNFLRQQAKSLKGVSLKIHDMFISRLEAVFARGGRKLGKLIEQAWLDGAYLDAWDEYFNKNIWREAASTIGIDFEHYASREIPIEDNLLWTFINTGVDESWLKNQFLLSKQNENSVPCDEKCSNCGVCRNFKTKPLKYEQMELETPTRENQPQSWALERTRYRLKITKKGYLKYISHLDWQGFIYKMFRRAGLKPVFSQGFNPTPKISAGVALPIFVESEGEYVDFELVNELTEEHLKKVLTEKFPPEAQILSIVKISKDAESLDKSVHWAKYSALPIDFEGIKKIDLEYTINEILAREQILFEKVNRKGNKKVYDIKPLIKIIEVVGNEKEFSLSFIIKSGQGSDSEEQNMNLRSDKFLELILPQHKWEVTRERLLDKDFKELV